MEFDWSVGEILKTLDEWNLTDRTLVILTSDNGPVLDDGDQDQTVERPGDLRPSGGLRGGRYSLYDGVTRVPMLVRWSGRIAQGTSGALISQVDFCGTLAALVNAQVEFISGPDSTNQVAALTGQSSAGRDHVIEHAGRLALREGCWKLIPAMHAKPAKGQAQSNRAGAVRDDPGAAAELYDLVTDPGERVKLAEREPDVLSRLTKRLRDVAQGN